MDKDRKILINEMFGPTLQGEGKYLGSPCVFIRTNSCNLRCSWKNSDGTETKCDTPYTSWQAEHVKPKTLEDVLNWFDGIKSTNPNLKHIIISGGEPFIQPALPQLIEMLKDKYDTFITVETNGTIFKETKADFISMSPKLLSSTPNKGEPEYIFHTRSRVYDNSMQKFIDFYKNIQFKFVYNQKSDINEIENEFISKYNLPLESIWLMPQGITKQQLELKSKELFDICSQKGYNFTPRLHIDVYNDIRGI